MKKFHLICNSHLDPVWLWDWEEGYGEAISTFYQAEQFCREYDFIFNHNESVLYEFVEEHDPELFAAIKEQVKAGKWHIMGGWYLQPDCNLPSGEAFVRQIGLGRKYFQEKFDARPTTVINFDSFGHSVGMVQIIKKCGYDSYICCRPMPDLMELPNDGFLWQGKDGSTIKVIRTDDENLYVTGYGTARKEIIRKGESFKNQEVGIALWGVGNHGGLPSRKDLEEVAEYIQNSDIEVLHSTPEQYFADINPTHVVTKSLQPCLVGCYTSMQSIKQKNIELENKLFTTEKLCAYAEMNGLYQHDSTVFTEAEKALASLEFHDILAGTCIEAGEKSSLRRADYALELLQKEWNKAFFAVCSCHKKADIGEFPIFIFNPLPFERKVVCETEYRMPILLISDEEQYTVTAYQDGKPLPTQCIKEMSNCNHADRVKRIAYECKLNPMSVNRVDFKVEITPKEFLKETVGSDILFEDDIKSVRISRETGLMESLVINGQELLSGGAFQPVMFEDDADPWGWYRYAVGTNPVDFRLSDCKSGPFENLKNVNVVEDGPVLTKVESYFDCGASYVLVSYKIYRNRPEIDVTVDVLWNEQQKALKIKIPTAVEGAFIGQIPFGTDTFEKDGKEIVAHRFVGFETGDKVFTLYNNCTYGFSAKGSDLYATLLRGAAYSAHPVDGHEDQLIDSNRFIETIEQGKHQFKFRLSLDKRTELENHAQAFVNTPYSLNYFPHGSGELAWEALSIDNFAVSLSAFYREGDGYTVRLINNNDTPQEATLTLCGHTYSVRFNAYEAKTYVYANNELIEKEIWL